MTASEHLKQRLATGSLGGDQDEKAVEELIAQVEQLGRQVAEMKEAMYDARQTLSGYRSICRCKVLMCQGDCNCDRCAARKILDRARTE